MSTHRKQQPRKQLTSERLRRSWSQQELAERLGTTPENVSRWERGVTFPRPYYRQKLCDLFQKNAEELGLFLETEHASEGVGENEASSKLTPSLPQVEAPPLAAQDHSEPEPALLPAGPSKGRSFRQKLFSRSLFIRGMLLLGAVLLLAGAYFSFAYKPSPTAPSHTGSRTTPTLPRTWHQTLNDRLTSADHSEHWSSNGKSCFYNAEAYEEIDTGLNYCNYGTSSQFPFHNLVYSVDLAIYQGNYAGLIFRLNHNNYYYFSLKITGTYELTRHEDADGGNDYLLYNGSSPFIHQGLRQWNTLTIFAQDATFQLWANGHYLATVSDNALTAGTIGVAVSIGGENSDTNAWFRNARIWQP